MNGQEQGKPERGADPEGGRIGPKGDKVEYLLRGVNRELWKEVQHRAIDEGVSKREWIILAIKEKLNRGGVK